MSDGTIARDVGTTVDGHQSEHHDSSRASTAGHQVTTSGQVFWLPDHSTHRAFPSMTLSGICGFRPRLQRRDRDGFTPSSLFSRTDNKSHEHPCRLGIVPNTEKNSTVRQATSPKVSAGRGRNSGYPVLDPRLRSASTPHPSDRGSTQSSAFPSDLTQSRLQLKVSIWR